MKIITLLQNYDFNPLCKGIDLETEGKASMFSSTRKGAFLDFLFSLVRVDDLNFFTYVTNTHLNLTTYSRKPETGIT